MNYFVLGGVDVTHMPRIASISLFSVAGGRETDVSRVSQPRQQTTAVDENRFFEVSQTCPLKFVLLPLPTATLTTT